MSAVDISQHYSRKAGEYGYDVRACEYKGVQPFIQRQKILLRMLKDFSGKTLLDIGCGTGALAAPLAGRNKLVGVDISPAMLGLARATHFPVSAHGKALPFPQSIFDAVLGIEVMQHLPDAAAFLAEMTRVAKPDGSIVLAMIHSRSWLQALLRAFGLSPKIYCWHSPEEIAGLLAGGGWNLSELYFLAMPTGVVWRSARPQHPLDFLAAAWVACFRKAES